MASLPDQGSAPVKSADRVLSILEMFAAAPAPRTYSEILRLTGLPKSSLHGLLATLTARGWLAEVDPGGAYTLGSRTLELGAAFLRTSGYTTTSPILDELAAAVEDTVNVGFLDGNEVVYLAVRRSRQALSMRSAVGVRLPAHASAMGKVLLTSYDDHEIRGRLQTPLARLARNTHDDIESLLRDVEETRQRGFAVEHEEATDGVGCMALLVEPPGRSALALSVSFALTRQAPGMEHRVLDALRTARDRLTAALVIDPGAAVE